MAADQPLSFYAWTSHSIDCLALKPMHLHSIDHWASCPCCIFDQPCGFHAHALHLISWLAFSHHTVADQLFGSYACALHSIDCLLTALINQSNAAHPLLNCAISFS